MRCALSIHCYLKCFPFFLGYVHVCTSTRKKATSSTDQKAVALDSALRKLLAFLQADTGNATALTTVSHRKKMTTKLHS
jgi:hypothetical protein